MNRVRQPAYEAESLHMYVVGKKKRVQIIRNLCVKAKKSQLNGSRFVSRAPIKRSTCYSHPLSLLHHPFLCGGFTTTTKRRSFSVHLPTVGIGSGSRWRSNLDYTLYIHTCVHRYIQLYSTNTKYLWLSTPSYTATIHNIPKVSGLKLFNFSKLALHFQRKNVAFWSLS